MLTYPPDPLPLRIGEGKGESIYLRGVAPLSNSPYTLDTLGALKKIPLGPPLQKGEVLSPFHKGRLKRDLKFPSPSPLKERGTQGVRMRLYYCIIFMKLVVREDGDAR